MAIAPEKRRTMLAQSIVECQGVVMHAAHHLGYSRSHMYRLLDQYRVWGVVNVCRIEAETERRKERDGV